MHTTLRSVLCRRGAALTAALLFFVALCAFTQTVHAQEPDLEILVEDGAAVEFHIAQVVIPGLEEPRMQKLMRAFTMTVRVDGEQVFRGTCDALPQPLFAPRLLSTESVMRIEIDLEFDKWSGNELQGIPYTMQFQFASQDELMHQIMLSTRVFNINGNVNPGDLLQYQIAVNHYSSNAHTTDSPFNPPTDPGSSEPVTNQYNNTNPFNPPTDSSNIRTGGILEQAVTEHLDVVLVALSALVIVCIILVLTVPAKRRQEDWQTQEE